MSNIQMEFKNKDITTNHVLHLCGKSNITITTFLEKKDRQNLTIQEAKEIKEMINDVLDTFYQDHIYVPEVHDDEFDKIFNTYNVSVQTKKIIRDLKLGMRPIDAEKKYKVTKQYITYIVNKYGLHRNVKRK